ncbi:protein kinase domain-containing protein [Streptomyces sp. SAS_270]|uniref:protein kinase domain-containing protein n=1 Tax=Streptomyces sp. SAS_270 TaxID=3412748 RepID=UPI00403C45F4
MSGETPDQGQGRIISGRYRLLRTLGAGGMGRVWLAYDRELACEVSMKEIALPDVPMDASEPAQRIARARSEARHAARLRGHPHVATVHDVVVHEGLPWIVMEYVPDAVDLQAVVRQSGPLPPAQTARVGLAVLDALTAGHRIGILHRDVKPANILLAPDASGDPYARVLLTDYGIALQPESHEPRLTSTAGILGTPGYLAPERARGEPPTPAADLFSLGATLYAAVEGRGPFDRHGDYATLTALLGEEPTPPVRAGELAPVLHGLLVKDPVRRLTPEAVARGLERAAQGAAGGFAPPQGWTAAPGVSAAGGFGQAQAGGSTGAPPPGYAASGPPGYVMGGPYGAHTPAPPADQPAATPQGPGLYMDQPLITSGPPTPGTFGGPAPGAPHTPGSPPAPHTPLGAPATPGQQPGSGGPYGSWNPYANSPTVSSYDGPGGPGAYAGGPGGPGGQGGPSGRGPLRGKPVGVVVAIVAAVALLVGGGVWAAVTLTGGDGDSSAHPTSSAPKPKSKAPGSALPYGQEVGLKKALRPGDCVHAVWSSPAKAFQSKPNLGVVNCAHDYPDGQVVSVAKASDYADASANGAAQCASGAQETADSLADAAVYAVTPTKEGFDAAGGGTACLVLGRHVPIGGEIGQFRETEATVWTTEMSLGDCWIYIDHKDSFTSSLTDCADGHTDQVIGFTEVSESMGFDEALQQGNKLCGNKFESTWAPGSDLVIYGYLSDESLWDKGFTFVVCTVAQPDHTQSSGAISAGGSV